MTTQQIFVVPYDFSGHARAALYTALDWAHRSAAEIRLLHVVQPPAYGYGAPAFGAAPAATFALPAEYWKEVRAGAEKALDEVAEAARSRMGVKIEASVCESSSVSEAIVQSAEEWGASLIVMGTHGRSGLAHLLLGSVAERTLQHAPCPVLAVPTSQLDD